MLQVNNYIKEEASLPAWCAVTSGGLAPRLVTDLYPTPAISDIRHLDYPYIVHKKLEFIYCARVAGEETVFVMWTQVSVSTYGV